MAFFSFIASDGVFIISIGENKNVNIIRSYAFPNDISDLNDDIGIATLADLADKYDKIGGEISGNVKIDGTLTLDIDDPDYDSGITFSKSLDNNLGTILTLTGYADNTNYRPLIRNIHNPVNNYDAATKKYVDDNLSVPNYHIVFLNLDGTVDQTSIASSIIYSEISAHLTNRTQSDYLDVFWDQTRFYAKCIEIIDINTGDLKFIGEVEFNGMQRYIVFTLTPQNVLTTTSIITFESISNKVASVVNYSTSTTKYPTTKAVFDEFQRKPAVIWETDGTGLVGLNTDMSDNPSWQLTNLDFSPFKRVKIYTRAAQKSGTTASASTTPAVVLEMSLDPRAAGPYGGHYLGSCMGQKPNDANRLFTVTCAISADKTSFAVIRMTTLYGTAATSNSDVPAYVFKIEGYYD